MYRHYYGLTERPFDLTPNPRYLMMTEHHQEALSTLEYGISGGKGVALVVGGAGTGKTTLVHAALERQKGRDSLGVSLSNPTLSRREFQEFLADGFGLGRRAAESKTRLLIDLRRLLESRHKSGAPSALIIDEAQSLPDELLEEIRLLANIETPTDKLLAVVLVGHPELAQRLNGPHLQQLKQRVALRAVLMPLTREQVAAYIATRIRIAGGDASSVFTPDAVTEIYNHSGGIPRTISVICDNALVSGFALDRRPVDRDIVLEICRDLDFKAPEPPAPAPVPPPVVVAPAPPPSASPASIVFEPVVPAATNTRSPRAPEREDVNRPPVPAVPAAVATRGFRDLFRSSRRSRPTSIFETQR